MDELMPYYDIINQQQQQNNAWSAEQAQKAMDYQERMSNTAHQREVADLKAAGLNPVLSAGGSGASTTSGVAVQAGNENVTALYGLVSKALDASLAQAQAAKTSAQMVAGATGSYNPTSIDDSESHWSDNPFINMIQDFVYRKTGIKQTSSDAAIDAFESLVKGDNSNSNDGNNDFKFSIDYLKNALGNLSNNARENLIIAMSSKLSDLEHAFDWIKSGMPAIWDSGSNWRTDGETSGRGGKIVQKTKTGRQSRQLL